jgi:type I restriction enzyme, R subunit
MALRSAADSEWVTRKKLIDKQLRSTGWLVTPYANKPLSAFERCAVEEYPTQNGPADYALVLDNQVIGIVEAKKLTLGPQNVLSQASRYSRGIHQAHSWDGHGVPFLYSTNGEVIWHHDVRHGLNRSREIFGFHTPTALQELFQRNFESACDSLLTTPNDHEFVRDYQKEANSATERAIADRKRAILLAMATGTGKTFTIVNEIYRMMRSGVAKRVLFLVDRRALAAQAVKAFASFEAEPGLKFNQIYETYHQRFHKDDLEEDEK